MIEPELEVGELTALAMAGKHARGKGAQGERAGDEESRSVSPADAIPPLADAIPPERSVRRSTVMDDAREVAARRKRQLGWGAES
jgi:hypothetical protein